jgi:hypothetical protein
MKLGMDDSGFERWSDKEPYIFNIANQIHPVRSSEMQ